MDTVLSDALGLLVLQRYWCSVTLAFDLLLFRLRFAVINECKDKASVFHFRGRTFRIFWLLSTSGDLHIHQLAGPWYPADNVENDSQVGEWGRKQRARVKELNCKVQSCIPEQKILCHYQENPSNDWLSNELYLDCKYVVMEQIGYFEKPSLYWGDTLDLMWSKVW